MTIKELQNNPEKIKTINRVFHDYDADTYEDEHPEIYELERASWKELMTNKLAPIMRDPDAILLDVGTGNGFVIEVISPFISPTQTVIFSDISKKMIAVVTEKFKDHNFKKEYVVSEAAHIPREDSSVDIVTVNSVLHHIPNFEEFLIEARRLLRPGGALIIKHEPNIRFPKNLALRSFYLFLNKVKRRGNQVTSQPVDHKLISALKEEGVIFTEPVTKHELQSLVDISSPTAAGGMDIDRGFDPFHIIKDIFPDAKESHVNTYAYFGKYNEKKNIITRMASNILKGLFPKDGYLFDLIVIK